MSMPQFNYMQFYEISIFSKNLPLHTYTTRNSKVRYLDKLQYYFLFWKTKYDFEIVFNLGV